MSKGNQPPNVPPDQRRPANFAAANGSTQKAESKPTSKNPQTAEHQKPNRDMTFVGHALPASITFRVTSTEKTQVLKHARDSKQTLSNFCRRRVLRGISRQPSQAKGNDQQAQIARLLVLIAQTLRDSELEVDASASASPLKRDLVAKIDLIMDVVVEFAAGRIRLSQENILETTD